MAKTKAVKIPRRYVVAVEEGVKFLDTVVGRKTWLARMNLEAFDISEPTICVAGSVFRDSLYGESEDGYQSFIEAVNALGGDGDKAAIRFGFAVNEDTDGEIRNPHWQYLQDLWVMKITRLKRAQRTR